MAYIYAEIISCLRITLDIFGFSNDYDTHFDTYLALKILLVISVDMLL